MLEAKNISFAYPGSKPLLANFNLTVTPGERLALVAPSGRGKTTLCKLLAGYLQPQTGELLLDGKPLPKQGPCPVQMIWQHPEQALDPRLRMQTTLAEAGVAAPELLNILGIHPSWLSRFPHELSGGELQRFCLARALATSPSYLIADEITTMLDALTQAQIWHVLLRQAEQSNIGMIIVSHSQALTRRLATRVCEL
jgi:peptide/nickel transport system ATP-binding protein